MQANGSNKAKIAKRVIEVLDFFDHDHPTATVMDIVRRYDRPQSSTSELLSSLVDLGLLYKDMATRSYTLTPRAAMLGSQTQPDFVRDGRLSGLVEKIAAQTHLSVGVFGMVGPGNPDFHLAQWRTAAQGDHCQGHLRRHAGADVEHRCRPVAAVHRRPPAP